MLKGVVAAVATATHRLPWAATAAMEDAAVVVVTAAVTSAKATPRLYGGTIAPKVAQTTAAAGCSAA